MDTRAWRAYALAGAVVLAGYLLVPVGLARDAVYVLTGLASATAVVVGTRRHRPDAPGPWWWLAAGQLTWSLADLTWVWYEHVRHVSPFPSPADAMYLVAYGMFATSFVLMLRSRRGKDVDGLLDAAILTVSVGLLSWVVLAQPTLADSDASVVERALGLGYPLADVLVFGLLVRLLSAPGGRAPALRLLIAGGAALFVADVTFALLTLAGGYDGGAVDLLWLAAYVLWGTSALHPSMRELSRPAPELREGLTARRLVLLTGASLTAPGTLAVQLALGGRVDGWAVVLSSVAMSLLVIARMAGLLRRVRRQADELDALSRTDGLTGLPNRRSCDAELGRAAARAAASGEPLLVAMVDLDRFKHYNDTSGHQAGDELLALAAARWSVCLSDRQVLARYGGEEFVLVVTGLGAGAVTALLNRMRRATPGGQTFSAGLAAWDRVETTQELLHRADLALYRAKDEGRDRVVLAPGTVALR